MNLLDIWRSWRLNSLVRKRTRLELEFTRNVTRLGIQKSIGSNSKHIGRRNLLLNEIQLRIFSADRKIATLDASRAKYQSEADLPTNHGVQNVIHYKDPPTCG